MKYFFILGNHPALSLAELAAVLGRKNLASFNEEAGVFELDNLNAEELILSLGGTIKIGEVAGELNSSDIADFPKLLQAAAKLLPEKAGGKFKFGISVYGKMKLNEKKLGMEVKRILKERGISARWVISREKQLSSVVVSTNKLAANFDEGGGQAKGLEIVISKIGEKVFIGKTLAVQPFRELSFRDYGRPARDDMSGMLPPKLAQIMINLSGAKKDGMILDPFCGSGTILTEAMLMGYKNIIGSDVSERAVNDTKKNVEWIKRNYNLQKVNCELFNKSATELADIVKKGSVDSIVTEPYLGPQRGRVDAGKVKRELEKLYSAALMEFDKVLKSERKAVMIWPVFREHGAMEKVTPDFKGFNIIKPEFFIKGVTDRGTFIYGREGQKVWREIVVLKRG